ncbi:acyl-CoA dehydrogenase family protein [Thermodesulfobacteriota bacterium]
MQYPFTKGQLELAERIRTFMQQEVAPVAAEIDARPDPKDCYPKELINKASRLGLRTIAVPEEYGGIGAGMIEKTLALWTGAQIEIGTIKCLSQCWKVTTAIAKVGTEAQKEKWFKIFVEDDDCVCSVVMTEPDHGSNNLYRQPDPGIGLETAAVKDGDYYVINGAKRFNSLVGFSKIYILFARTDPNVPVHKGTTCFLVHGDQPGVIHGEVHDKLGYRLYPTAASAYEDVRVHKDDILGTLNGGFETFASVFRGSAELPANNTGIMRGIFNFCNGYAKQRIQGGKPIIEHQNVQSMLAKMLMDIEVAEQFMWRICWGVENDPTFNPRFTRYGKVFSDQASLRVIGKALDILGGVGILRDYPVEKMIRDLLTFLHGDGTDSLNLLRAAQTLDDPA